MQRPAIAISGCLALSFGLSACGGANNAPDATALPPVPESVAAIDSPSMRYQCEGGYQVAIFGDTARVITPDEQGVDLSRDPQRSPPLFTGEALEFSVGSDGAVLAQDEGGRHACQGVD